MDVHKSVDDLPEKPPHLVKIAVLAFAPNVFDKYAECLFGTVFHLKPSADIF